MKKKIQTDNDVANVQEPKYDDNSSYEHDKETRSLKCKMSEIKERAQIMAENSEVAACVFNLFVHTFVYILLGINLDSTTRTSNHAHKKGRFGWMLALYAAIEAQCRELLHIHALL